MTRLGCLQEHKMTEFADLWTTCCFSAETRLHGQGSTAHALFTFSFLPFYQVEGSPSSSKLLEIQSNQTQLLTDQIKCFDFSYVQGSNSAVYFLRDNWMNRRTVRQLWTGEMKSLNRCSVSPLRCSSLFFRGVLERCTVFRNQPPLFDQVCTEHRKGCAASISAALHSVVCSVRPVRSQKEPNNE